MSYPKMLFTATGLTTTVASATEEAALSARIWQDNPANWGLVTAPSVAQTAANALSASTLFPRARQLTAETVASTDVRTRAATLGF